MTRYLDSDPRKHDLHGRIAYLAVMTDDADQISGALELHMSKNSDAGLHAFLHRLHAVLRSFFDAMRIELARYDAAVKV
jgi:hypothetical protein